MKKIFALILILLLVFAVSCGGENAGDMDTTVDPDSTSAPTTSEPDGTPADTPAGTETPETTEGADSTETPEVTTEAPVTSDGIGVGSDTDERPWGDPHFPA